MSSTRVLLAAFFAILMSLIPVEASAVVTVYFSPDQVATPAGAGVTSDTITCEGYAFAYTRDKLFTGGGPDPIGRPVRVAWPAGVEAQYVTAGPNPGKAQITVWRVDGGLFDLTSFTAKLLANAGAGRAIEIVPLLNGQEPLNDPLFFDVSGSAGMEFSYDTSPNPLGSTAALVNYDAYVISLTLDYALTALTLTDPSPPVSVETDPRIPAVGELRVTPNPTFSPVELSLSGNRSVAGERLLVFSAQGARVRSLRLDASGRTTWDLHDDRGRPVAAGIYFVTAESASRPSKGQRVIVVR